jgi:hypothetical protein
VWQGILTEKDKKQAIAEYLKSLESGPTSGSSTDVPSSSSAPAAAAVKTKRSDYETKVVCFSDSEKDHLCQELLKEGPSVEGSYLVQDDLHGRFEAVKHPNVLVVTSVRDFGIGSFKILKKLRGICDVATV